MATPRSTATEALESAARSLAGAQADALTEAAWIGRNNLGTDPAYLRASLESRKHEINRAHRDALAALDNALDKVRP